MYDSTHQARSKVMHYFHIFVWTGLDQTRPAKAKIERRPLKVHVTDIYKKKTIEEEGKSLFLSLWRSKFSYLFRPFAFTA